MYLQHTLYASVHAVPHLTKMEKKNLNNNLEYTFRYLTPPPSCFESLHMGILRKHAVISIRSPDKLQLRVWMRSREGWSLCTHLKYSRTFLPCKIHVISNTKITRNKHCTAEQFLLQRFGVLKKTKTKQQQKNTK